MQKIYKQTASDFSPKHKYLVLSFILNYCPLFRVEASLKDLNERCLDVKRQKAKQFHVKLHDKVNYSWTKLIKDSLDSSLDDHLFWLFMLAKNKLKKINNKS